MLSWDLDVLTLSVQETWIRYPGQKAPWEKEVAAHSSILAWRIPWTEEPVGLYSPWGHKELDMTKEIIPSTTLPKIKVKFKTTSH